MINHLITRSVQVEETPRVKQMRGFFDVPPSTLCERSWTVNLEIADEWNIGLIVGPSGAGKSTVAREVFGDRVMVAWEWPASRSILDGFPAKMSIRDITALLNSVGFSSPPAWVKPFSVLSNGEQFRVNLARTLAEQPDLAVVDEFTSVVDRQVAQIGSAAVAKTVRRRGKKFVAVSCHYDIADWLEPDWVYEPLEDRLTRGRLRRRPALALEVARVHRQAWKLFKSHHYLSADIHKGSKCFVAFLENRPVAFTAVLPFPTSKGLCWREHRTVCLPDFQGIGIGNKMSEYVASLFQATGHGYVSTTSHPSMIQHRNKSPLWKLMRKPGLNRTNTGNLKAGFGKTCAVDRLTCGFRYVGPANAPDASGFLVA